MPKSKRAKVGEYLQKIAQLLNTEDLALVSLTKTAKKDRSSKETLLKEIQANADKWKYVYVFRIGQMRNSHLKTVRKLWKDDARMFFGKCAVVSKALGTSPETEHRLGLHKVAERIKGQRGLFFTSYAPEQTEEWFLDFKAPDFARTGNIADRDVTLPTGPIHRSTDPPEPFPHSMDPQLRKLGLNTSLVKGVPTLTTEHIVCRRGQALTAEQAQLLKLLLIQMVTFRVTLIARWDSSTGQVADLNADEEEDPGVVEEEDQEMSE